ncbi:long-chain fatty acid transport protein [Rhizobium sp. SG_E_25_P2]|jgi:long-chain fatty acid transport protein|uniref:OmpP1/FadL family transporter n=1 Tax=Rhizobium sp. SG_E_25_P2 TaxID=2879942 RepID=UPI0024730912|nr:OmpP1/FadL family transporter [Rhizobium sp. SG_E_25_P2]MDH6265739.1 long-chain fatty acid transport protein [Rhizobium sp. SG_E_25_P2]
MGKTMLRKGFLTVISAGFMSGAAYAGGIERNGYNIDLLFDPSNVAVEGTATYVTPHRTYENTTNYSGVGGTDPDVRDTKDYFNGSVGVKARVVEGVDCLVDYSQPWGAHSAPGLEWTGSGENSETKINSDNYGLTCSYKFDMGKGQLRLIGGGFYQTVDGFKESLVTPAELVPGFDGTGRLDLDSDGWGWRAGVAYEIPEYAFRASLVYNSEVKLDEITGTLDMSNVSPAVVPSLGGVVWDVYGSTKMPDSIELSVQSGIAPDWLAFGSVKWTDWSQLQTIPFYLKGTDIQATSLDLFYRDGWTVTGGVGHQFTEKVSGAVSVTWDRGTSQGYGSQTDTWLFGTGVNFAATKNVDIKLSGAVGWMKSGSSGAYVYNGVTYGVENDYDFGTDFVGAISTGIKVKF